MEIKLNQPAPAAETSPEGHLIERDFADLDELLEALTSEVFHFMEPRQVHLLAEAGDGVTILVSPRAKWCPIAYGSTPSEAWRNLVTSVQVAACQHIVRKKQQIQQLKSLPDPS